jgi:hypothetical protein
MRYWWVNQNQTFRHEVEGGYLWSPKRNANGARNPFYETMREVQRSELCRRSPGLECAIKRVLRGAIAASRTLPWLASGWECRGRRLSRV